MHEKDSQDQSYDDEDYLPEKGISDDCEEEEVKRQENDFSQGEQIIDKDGFEWQLVSKKTKGKRLMKKTLKSMKMKARRDGNRDETEEEKFELNSDGFLDDKDW